MPKIDAHIARSVERTGKEYREVHEWIDHPEHKVERHDIGRVLEFARIITEAYGAEAAEEYVRHLQDDVQCRFNGMVQDLQTRLADALGYFGCAP